jgi:2-aminoadipate transaminase
MALRFRFSRRVEQLHGLPDLAIDPGVLDLSTGVPASETYPMAEVHEALVELTDESSVREVMDYTYDRGSPALIESISQSIAVARGAEIIDDRIVITNGALDGLALVAHIFADRNAAVLTEDYTYSRSIQVLRSFFDCVVAVDCDTDGPIPDSIVNRAKRIRAHGFDPRLLYVIPDAHNPCGRTTSEARRRMIASACAAVGVSIAEDVVYRDIYFGPGPPPVSFSALDPAGVIQLNSLSKILAPGFRLGWIDAPPSVTSRLRAIKWDAGSNPVASQLASLVISKLNWLSRLRILRRAYEERATLLLDGIESGLGGNRIMRPSGGFFLWIPLALGSRTAMLCRDLEAQGVIVSDGEQFRALAEAEPGIRLCFSHLEMAQLAEAGAKVGQVLAAGSSSWSLGSVDG